MLGCICAAQVTIDEASNNVRGGWATWLTSWCACSQPCNMIACVRVRRGQLVGEWMMCCVRGWGVARRQRLDHRAGRGVTGTSRGVCVVGCRQVDAGNKELSGVVEEQTAIRKRITILLVVLGVCVVGGAIAAIVMLV